ncbi:signal peptidase I [Kitasatospora sp. NBC_00315]|uniref:signal peptidase I n=1 Tax=Kitasatospora sp. NBC_00315 TaxID=2975963 RepID=UPI00324A31D1
MSNVAEKADQAAGRPVRAARPGRRPSSIVQGVAIGLGLVLMLGGFALIAVDYRPYRIPSASMTPTLQIGDTVLARKADGGTVGRGDVVVFRDQAWGGELMVKRVVAVGGDTVACCGDGNRLSVNGEAVDEPYLTKDGVQGAAFSVQVPAGRLFMLGDNRMNSLDSRTHVEVAGGSVPATDVVARVEATIQPFGRLGMLGRPGSFDAVGGPGASAPGPLEPAAYATVVGAGLIVLTCAVSGVAGWAGRVGRRRSKAGTAA